MLPPPTRLVTINERFPSMHNTNMPCICNTTNSHPLREPQIVLCQARTRMSQTSSTHDWLELNISNNNRGEWLRRENACARKKKKKSNLRFLNPNEPYGLRSIFNRGRKQFLAPVQFHPRPNITAPMAFLKY